MRFGFDSSRGLFFATHNPTIKGNIINGKLAVFGGGREKPIEGSPSSIDRLRIFIQKHQDGIVDTNNTPEDMTAIVPEYGELYLFTLKNPIVLSVSRFAGLKANISAKLENGDLFLTVTCNKEKGIQYQYIWDKNKQNFVTVQNDLMIYRENLLSIIRNYQKGTIKTNDPMKNLTTDLSGNKLYLFDMNSKPVGIHLHLFKGKKILVSTSFENGKPLLTVTCDKVKNIKYQFVWDDHKQRFTSLENELDVFRDDLQHFVLNLQKRSFDNKKLPAGIKTCLTKGATSLHMLMYGEKRIQIRPCLFAGHNILISTSFDKGDLYLTVTCDKVKNVTYRYIWNKNKHMFSSIPDELDINRDALKDFVLNFHKGIIDPLKLPKDIFMRVNKHGQLFMFRHDKYIILSVHAFTNCTARISLKINNGRLFLTITSDEVNDHEYKYVWDKDNHSFISIKSDLKEYADKLRHFIELFQKGIATENDMLNDATVRIGDDGYTYLFQLNNRPVRINHMNLLNLDAIFSLSTDNGRLFLSVSSSKDIAVIYKFVWDAEHTNFIRVDAPIRSLVDVIREKGQEILGINTLAEDFSDRPDRLMDFCKYVFDVPPEDLVQMGRGYAELNLGEGQKGGNLYLTPLSRQRRKEGHIKKMGAIMDRINEFKGYIKRPEFLKKFFIDATQKDYYESFNNENDFKYALKTLEDEIAIRKGFRKEVLEAVRQNFVSVHEWRTPPTIDATLYLHQKEGAMFLVEREKALVSDEPRLGKTLQALAAAETLRLSGKAKKIVIVCPSPIKAVWSEQIDEHANRIKHLVHVVEGTQEQKRKVYERFEKEGGYLIVNYENLRKIGPQEIALRNIDAGSEEMGMREEEKPYAVAALKDADIAILDEVQAIDNPMAYQTQAIKEFLNPERIWALSATPYSNLPHKLFHLLQYLFPEDPEYSDKNHQTWKQTYAETADGLRVLFLKMQDISIRRKKDDMFGRYPEEAEFDPNYMEKYGLMLPNKVEIPYREAGEYKLNKEQFDIIRKIIFDFRSWAREFNAGLPQGNKRRITDIYEVNPFQKLLYIFYATLDPKLVGGKTDSPLYSELDKLVRVKIAKGEKILIFTEHTYFVDALLERYKDLGVARFDGVTNEYMDVTSNQKAQQIQRQKFQDDPNIRIMVANTVSGGAGVTFSAAQNLIFLEKGWTYTKQLQAMDRPDSKDAEHMKPRYNIYTMVGTYPDEFVRSLPASERRSFELSPRELLEENLEGKKHLYHMVMDGYVTDEYIKEAIEKAITNRILPAEMIFRTNNEKENAITAILRPINETWENEGLDTKPLNALGAAFSKYPVELLNDIVNQYIAGGFDASIMEAISLHMDQQHRELKKNMLVQTADLLESLKGKKISPDLTGISHKRSRLAALFATKGDPEALKMLGAIYKDLDGIADRKDKAKDDLFIGMSLLNGSYLNVTRTNPSLFEKDPLSATELLFHLGILKNATGWLPSSEDMSSVPSLNAAIDEAYIQGFNKVLGTEAPISAVRTIFNKWGGFHQLFGIAAGLRSKDMKKEMQKLRETFEKITAGNFHDWRRTNGSVLYKDNDSKFWNAWLANHNITLSNISLELGISDRLRPMLDDIIPKMESVSKSFFNRQLVPAWTDYLRSQDKAASMRKVSDNIVALRSEKGRLFRSNKPTNEIESGIKENEILLKFMTLHSLLTDLRPTNEWAKAALKSIEDVDKIISPMIYSLLTLRASKQKALRNNLEILHGIIRTVGRKVECGEIEIFDTDDPKLILESGAFAPDMANCMHFLGDPQQNKALIDTLGSKNKKLLIVKVNGRIRSASTVKIRKDEKGNPVLFIEKPLHKEGYSFLEEMAWFLQKKATMMGAGTRVAIQAENDNQLRGKEKFELHEEMVSNTGNYSQEYVEANFLGDKSGNFSHTAIILTKKP